MAWISFSSRLESEMENDSWVFPFDSKSFLFHSGNSDHFRRNAWLCYIRSILDPNFFVPWNYLSLFSSSLFLSSRVSISSHFFLLCFPSSLVYSSLLPYFFFTSLPITHLLLFVLLLLLLNPFVDERPFPRRSRARSSGVFPQGAGLWRRRRRWQRRRARRRVHLDFRHFCRRRGFDIDKAVVTAVAVAAAILLVAASAVAVAAAIRVLANKVLWTWNDLRTFQRHCDPEENKRKKKFDGLKKNVSLSSKV